MVISAKASSHHHPGLLSPEEVSSHPQRWLILDVQNPKYAKSTVPRAKRLNVDILMREISKAQPILLICLDGRRSLAAAQQLTRRGYLSVYALKGGIIGWQQAGYTLQGLHYDHSPTRGRGN
jgi:rhodanese-related sulfurtransferase